LTRREVRRRRAPNDWVALNELDHRKNLPSGDIAVLSDETWTGCCGLASFANASDHQCPIPSSLALLKMLRISSPADFQKGHASRGKINPPKRQFEPHNHWRFRTICVCMSLAGKMRQAGQDILRG
jgi:hypothetical protein